MAISDKLNYLIETKSQLKDMINYGLDDDNKITNSTTFRNYVTSVFKAFLESLNNPDTLFTNLPKKSGTGSNITLNDTANAPMRIMLNASDITQDGTPTPDNPQDIHTISGSNKLVVCGNNLFTIKNYSKRGWNITIDNPLKGMTAGIYSISAVNNYITSGKGVAIYNANTVNAGINDRIGTLLTNYDFGNTTLKHENISLTQEQLDSNYMIIAPTDNACTEETLNNMKIMIEKGSTATTYEPYISQEADIDLGYENLWNENTQVFTPQSLFNNPAKNQDNSWTFTSTGSGYAFAISKITLPAGTYKFSSTCVNGNTTILDGGTELSNPFTINTTKEITYRVFKSSAVAGDRVYLSNVMLEKGSTAHTYTPYGKQINYSKISTYEDKFIRTSGKNKLNLGNISGTNNGVAYSINNGQLLLNGACNSDRITINLPTQQALNGTYTFSTNYIKATALKNGSSTNLFLTTSSSGVKTETINDTITQLVIYGLTGVTFSNQVIELQVESGNSYTSFEPYGSNEWYIKKNIGKVVLDGTEDWRVSNTGTPNYQLYCYVNENLGGDNQGYSNYYPVIFITGTNTNQGIVGVGHYIRLRYGEEPTIADLKTWLSSHNVILYQPLILPTYTQITGTLAEQLEYVYQLLKSYKGVTNISQVNNDLPFELDVEAIEEI